MWSIISFCVCLFLGFITIWITNNSEELAEDPYKDHNICVSFAVLTIVFWAYAITGFSFLIATDSKHIEYEKYVKAKSYCEILKTDIELPLDVIKDYKIKIESMNELIDKSKKRCNHPYYSPFYHKETGDLEKLNCDTINVKIKL